MRIPGVGYQCSAVAFLLRLAFLILRFFSVIKLFTPENAFHAFWAKINTAEASPSSNNKLQANFNKVYDVRHDKEN